MRADSTFRDPNAMGVLARSSVVALNNVTIANTQLAALWVEQGSDVRAHNTTFDQTQSNNPWVSVAKSSDTLYVDDPAALTSAQVHEDSRGVVSTTPAARATDSIFPRATDPAFVRLQQVRKREQPGYDYSVESECLEFWLACHQATHPMHEPHEAILALDVSYASVSPPEPRMHCNKALDKAQHRHKHCCTAAALTNNAACLQDVRSSLATAIATATALSPPSVAPAPARGPPAPDETAPVPAPSRARPVAAMPIPAMPPPPPASPLMRGSSGAGGNGAWWPGAKIHALHNEPNLSTTYKIQCARCLVDALKFEKRKVKAVGGGVGGLVVLLSVIAAVVVLRRRRRRTLHKGQAPTELRSGATADAAAAQPSGRLKSARSYKATATLSGGQVSTGDVVSPPPPQSAHLMIASDAASSAEPSASRGSDHTPGRAPGGMTTATWSMSTATANTLSKTECRAQLVTALEHISREHPPPVFAGRYVLLQERVSGGQAVVNFARGADGGYFQYAIKCASTPWFWPPACELTPACERPPACELSLSFAMLSLARLLCTCADSSWTQPSLSRRWERTNMRRSNAFFPRFCMPATTPMAQYARAAACRCRLSSRWSAARR